MTAAVVALGHRPRHWYRRYVVAAALAATMLSGCGPVRPDLAAGQPVPAPVVSSVELSALLADSWVSDGTLGYFVDGAASSSTPAFSLYDTLWWTRLYRLRSPAGVAAPGSTASGATGLDPRAVAAWAGAALDPAIPGTGGLPPLVRLCYAVTLLTLVGAPLDVGMVRTALDRVRQGGQYRDGSGAGPDWGATALAVRAQTQLGLPVPDPVRPAALAALDRADLPLTQRIAVIQVLAELDPARTRTTLAGTVFAALATLAATAPDPAWLAARYGLADAAGRAGLPVPPLSPVGCAALVGTDGGIALPGAPTAHEDGSTPDHAVSTVDPQATFYAAALGCPVHVAAPAHSRAGWPTATARAHALAASAGALRVAARLGVAGRYAPGLAAQARRAWLPPLSTNPAAGDLSARVNRVNLKLVAAGLDPATRDTVRAALPTPAPAVPDTELSLLLLVVDAAVASPDPARMAEIRAQMSGWTGAGTGSMLAVAALALAGRLFAVPQWTSQAVALAGPLRRPTGGYTLGGPAGTPASLTASAIGAWLVPPDTNPVSGWVRVGLCTAHRCAESVAILSTVDYLSWRVAAQLLAGQQGAYQDLFPVSF